LKFSVFIPARYGSTRLPGKPLLEIRGKPLLQHVFERACESGASEVVVATDDTRIAEIAASFGAAVCMTATDLMSGTDRIAVAVAERNLPVEAIVVNLQGDEPQMPAAVIRQVAERVAEETCDMASVCEPLSEAQLFDPNVVKVVRDVHCRALYFSRASIPWERDSFAQSRNVTQLAAYRRHVGIYAYRVAYLRRFVALPSAPLEQIEALEQLRALANGARIDVPDAVAACGSGVDTPADLERLRHGQ
jgi:3-deoxy-manno-octulosonate cytidylyltransferase (CMP-KDO synthetase)